MIFFSIQITAAHVIRLFHLNFELIFHSVVSFLLLVMPNCIALSLCVACSNSQMHFNAKETFQASFCLQTDPTYAMPCWRQKQNYNFFLFRFNSFHENLLLEHIGFYELVSVRESVYFPKLSPCVFSFEWINLRGAKYINRFSSLSVQSETLRFFLHFIFSSYFHA